MKEHRPPVLRYGLAIAVTAVAVAFRYAIDPWLGTQNVLITMPAAVAAAVWYGGIRAGTLAAVAGYVACDYLFMNGPGFGPYATIDAIRLFAYFVSSAIIIGFGEAARLVAIMRRQSRAEEVRRQSDSQFRLMADTAPVLIWMSDVDKKRTWFNRQWLEFVGRTLEQESGDGWAENVHPEDFARCIETYVASFDARRPFSMEYRMRRHDGEYRWVLDNGLPRYGSSGEFTGYVGSAIDETERVRADQALKETEERFSRFMQHLPGLAWMKDVQGRYVFANDAAIKAFRTRRQLLYGRTDHEVFSKEAADEFAANDRRALDGGIGVQTIERLEHADGVVHHSIVSKFPIPGPQGDAAWIGGMAIDITERLRAEEALREADRRKTDFLATLSHELRNPLAPIRNALELLRRSGPNTTAGRASLDIMERQVSHMVRLIDDLLDLSRITRDRLDLRKSRVDLGNVIHQAIETCQEAADRSGQTIELSLPADVVHLDADPVRLVQVFSNLLNNACKYSTRPGRIRVVASVAGGTVEVAIVDEGMGIPPEALGRVFEMFSNAGTAAGRARDSLGIGLALVKRLVELHGGNVEARSAGPGHGSEFIVRLPVTLPGPPASAPVLVTTDPAAVGLRVLVVDDNADSADSLATLLMLGGHQTATAHDGPEALALAKEFRPHVAILDVGLPTLSGHAVCRELRNQPWGRDVFIVALTGWGQQEDRRKSREAGFDDHFVKPLDHAELLSRLRAVPTPPR
jgi:PAS domain S-box-containing protein